MMKNFTEVCLWLVLFLFSSSALAYLPVHRTELRKIELEQCVNQVKADCINSCSMSTDRDCTLNCRKYAKEYCRAKQE